MMRSFSPANKKASANAPRNLGIGAELRASLFQLVAKLAKILDDAVVDHGEALGRMRVRVMFGRSAVGRPAGVADADRAGERLAREPCFEIAQLALGTPTRELPAFQRGHARRVIAAIFEPLERINKQARDRLPAENAYNSAHATAVSSADYSPPLNVSAVKATREITSCLSISGR